MISTNAHSCLPSACASSEGGGGDDDADCSCSSLSVFDLSVVGEEDSVVVAAAAA